VPTILALFLTLCFGGRAAAAVKNPDTFVYLAATDGDSLDPAWSYDSRTHSVIVNVYEHLLWFGPDGELVPALSETVPTRANGLVSADGLTYRFPIRKGVRFHDGALMTPNDVRYSLLRFMLFDRAGGPSALLLEPVLGLGSTRRDGKLIPDAYERAARAVTVDGDAVVVRLRKPFAPFLSIVAMFGAVVSRDWCAARGQWDGAAATWRNFNDPKLSAAIPNEEANGTGPFKLERYDKANRQILLARNDAYWRGPARLARVVIKVVPEFTTRRLMLQAGDADSIDVTPFDVSQLRGLPGVELIENLKKPVLSPFLTFNRKINPAGNPNIGSGRLDGDGIPPDFFADRDVRQGFAFSIDYDAYVRDVERGGAKQAAGFIPEGMLGHRDGPPRYRFDPAQAAAHFKAAFGGAAWKKGFRFRLAYPEGRDNQQALARMLKKNVEALNPLFRIDVAPTQSSSLMAMSALHQRTLGIENWYADFADPDNFAFPLLHSAGMYASNGYFNPEADRLVEAAAAASDPRERARIYARLQDIAAEDVAFVVISEGGNTRAQRSWVKGYRFLPILPSAPWSSYYYDLSKSE
jgi:peptide/nickel transport system substrate-binding protein